MKTTFLIAGVGAALAITFGMACTFPESGDAGHISSRNGVRTKGSDMADGKEVAVFAAGCFWGIEAAFQKIEGVVDTDVGYTGGHAANPTYKQVCAGDTGHAEAVRVTYDPDVVDYETLVDTFWSIHDPTQVDRQGPDVGSQYRSAIFTQNEEQKQIAEASRDRLQTKRPHLGPIATVIEPASDFWMAEDYHQDYARKHGGGCALP